MTTAEDTAVQNVYLERGIALTPDEYQLVQQGLTIIAQAAEQDAKRKPLTEAMQRRAMAGAALELSVRLEQYVIAGSGITKELLERFKGAMLAAMKADDPARMGKVLVDYLAMLSRVSADPGHDIAYATVELLSSLVQERRYQRAGADVLVRLRKELVQANEQYGSAGRWPDGPDVMAYAIELVDYGLDQCKEGTAPWTK